MENTEEEVIPNRNEGFMCRNCGKYFHYGCLSMRINAVNCSDCELAIRTNGPKSHDDFVRYIRESQTYNEEFDRNFELISSG